jgi:hypothetical protein
MSIIVEAKQFEMPDEGVHEAEIVEVQDLGITKTAFGDKERVLLRYRIDQKGSDGEYLTVIESFNKTIGKNSRLAERIERLTGVMPTQRYDLITLVGWKGTVVVAYNQSNGTTYANIDSVIRKKNAHGVDVTDKDVEFPGDNN